MINADSIHIYPSNMKWETRIEKISSSLISSGTQKRIIVVGLSDGGSRVFRGSSKGIIIWLVPRFPDQIRVLNSRFVLFAKLYCAVLWRTRKMKFLYCNPHSLTTLPLAVLMKIGFSQRSIVYDTHELETEGSHLSPIRKILSKCLERVCILFVSKIVTVNPSIAEWYRNKYAIDEVISVRNYPKKLKVSSASLRASAMQSYKNPQNSRLQYCYHGVLSPDRLTGYIADIFANDPTLGDITFIGFGENENYLKDLSLDNKNIQFLKPKPISELLLFISTFDISLSLTKVDVLNHKYSLPNKLFEAISVGLPVIVNAGGDSGKMIEEKNLGWAIHSPEKTLAEFLKNMDLNDIKLKKKSVLKHRKEFTWEREESTLLSIYQRRVDDE